MTHNWKLNCTIDDFIDMVIKEHPEIQHLASIIGKCENRLFQYENNCFSEDEYSAMLPVLKSEIHRVFHSYIDSYQLAQLMNPHLRAIWKRQPAWLAPRLGITEVSARQLKNIARSNMWSALNAAQEYLFTRFGREIPSWSTVHKDVKKYYRED